MKENNIQEIWKDIPGYEGHYQASNFGRIRSFKRNKVSVLKNHKIKSGYYKVKLCLNSVAKYSSVHRLVWSAFNGAIPEGLEVNHKDEDKANNALLNLELVTPSQNCNYGTRNKRISEKMCKRIQMIDKNNNNIIKTFNSLIEATQFLNKKYPNNISCCLNGYSKSAYGYKWKFEA